MDVREKLIDLIIDAKRTDTEEGSFTEYLADCLINNGVTVQEWIPVTERLPEKNKEVVGWYKDNPFSPFRYGIVSWNGHGWVFTYAQRYVDAVTYWMPLPELHNEERP